MGLDNDGKCVVCRRALGWGGGHKCTPGAVRNAERRRVLQDTAHDGPTPEPDESERLDAGLVELFGPNGEFG